MTNEHDEEQFLSHIREHPEDKGALGVYADWLEEHGNRPAIAEMIRRHVNGHGEAQIIHSHPRVRVSNASNLGYVQVLPDKEHDLIAAEVPSGHPNRTLYLSAWMPRRVSKRLVPALHKEGINSNLPPNANHSDIENRRIWDADTTTQPEVHQMSRKPLVVSYDKNHRRFSLKKYAQSTVARVAGHGAYGHEMAPMMQGSRLATVLREIKHGVGKENPRLQKLTEHALGGTHKSEVYTGIRDELFRSKDPRAVQLARQYNWHKVGEGLERDRHLKEFVESSSKGTQHENHHERFRRFYNGIVHGKNGPSDNVRAMFYEAMHAHLKSKTGKDHSDEDIQDSLRRLGETEHNLSHTVGKKPQSKFEIPDYEKPAYSGTPKEGKSPPKRQVTPRGERAPGQFQRPRFRFKL